MKPMDKSSTKPEKEPAKQSVKEPAKIGSVEVEAFAHNIARLVEEGGKALAAYLKPREEGKIKDETADGVADVVKTVGQVLEYWLADPERALELQTVSAATTSICGGARSSAWPASRPHRWSHPTPRISASPIRNGRRTSSSISSSRSICSPCNGQSAWCARPKLTIKRDKRRRSTSSRSAMRSRRRISC